MLQNIVNNTPRPAAWHRDVGAWQVPEGSAEDLGFALKCVRNAPAVDYPGVVTALRQIGLDATWIGDEQYAELAVATGSPISFLKISVARVNAWLASIDSYVARFGRPCGTIGIEGDGVVHHGGVPTAMILAGDSTSLTAWALAQGLLSGSPLVVKPSNVEPLSAFLFCQAAIKHGIRAPNLVFLDSSSDPDREMIRRMVVHCGQSVIYGEDATVEAVYGSVGLSPAHKTIPYWTGRSGAIVFDTADPALAARCIVRGAASDRGNMCNSTKKVFAPIAMRSQLEALLVAEAEAVRRGDPLDSGTELGRLDPVARRMAEQRSSGARVIYDRDIVLADCDDGSPLLLEETPYPIVGIRYYRTSENPVDLANGTVRGTPSGRALVIAAFAGDADSLRGTNRLLAHRVVVNAATSMVDHSRPHQGIHLALELMRPVVMG